MRKNLIWKRVLTVTLSVVLTFVLFACGSNEETGTAEVQAASSAVSVSSSAGPQKALLFGKKKDTGSGTSGSGGSASAPAQTKYKIPEFRDAVFDADAAEGTDLASVDLSHCDEGYVGLHCISEKKTKFQVLKDDLTYTYEVVNGEDQIYPLQSGDGHYTFTVWENIADTKYLELYKCEADVTIEDPLDPFLRPNQYADYSKDSKCVAKAKEIAESSADEKDFISKVYDYIIKNVKYDFELAENLQPGYLPDPDKTFETNKGICLEYSSLAASMLRSQGVPTKIIFGYVAPKDIYHAWNMFYTEEDGWTLVEFKVSGKIWTRIDTTFYANGTDADYIGDGTNYMDAFQY